LLVPDQTSKGKRIKEIRDAGHEVVVTVLADEHGVAGDQARSRTDLGFRNRSNRGSAHQREKAYGGDFGIAGSSSSCSSTWAPSDARKATRSETTDPGARSLITETGWIGLP